MLKCLESGQVRLNFAGVSLWPQPNFLGDCSVGTEQLCGVCLRDITNIIFSVLHMTVSHLFAFLLCNSTAQSRKKFENLSPKIAFSSRICVTFYFVNVKQDFFSLAKLIILHLCLLCLLSKAVNVERNAVYWQ